MVDRVRDRGERRHDGHLADPSHPVRMARVRDLHEDGVDHRKVRGDRDPVVEEARVLEGSRLAVDVLLVEGPADPLRRPALELPLDVARVDGPADVLDRGVAKHGDPSGIRVDLHVADVGAEGRSGPARVDRRLAGDGPAGLRRALREGGEGERREVAHVAARGARFTVLPRDSVDVDVPDHRRPGGEAPPRPALPPPPPPCRPRRSPGCRRSCRCRGWSSCPG